MSQGRRKRYCTWKGCGRVLLFGEIKRHKGNFVSTITNHHHHSGTGGRCAEPAVVRGTMAGGAMVAAERRRRD